MDVYPVRWELVPEMESALERFDGPIHIVEKGAFGSNVLSGMAAELCGIDARIDIVGVCTDICVVSNALMIRAECPEADIRVIADACGGVTRERHDAALMTMESCHIDIVK